MAAGLYASLKTQKVTELPSIDKLILEGSYSKQGGRNSQSASASIADRNHTANYVEAFKNAVGEEWTYTGHRDKKGNPILTPYYDHECGEMVFPDKDGYIRAVNKDYVEQMVQMEQVIEDKVDRMVEKAKKSENLCKMVLNLDVGSYDKFLAPITSGGDAAIQTSANMSTDMQALDGRFLALRSLPTGSMSQIAALSKLRAAAYARRHVYYERDLHRHVGDAGHDATNKEDAEALKKVVDNNPMATVTYKN